MQRLLFLSTISVSLVASSGCSDDAACGTGGAPESGLVAADMDVQLNFGSLSAGANNDCPDPMAPSGIVSLTITGTQVGGPGLLTLCVPRPDLLSGGVPLSGSGVRVIDLNGEANNCMYALESTRPTTGTVTASGLCSAGTDKAGFALTVDGGISLRRVCPTATDTVAVTFIGTVAVKVP